MSELWAWFTDSILLNKNNDSGKKKGENYLQLLVCFLCLNELWNVIWTMTYQQNVRLNTASKHKKRCKTYLLMSLNNNWSHMVESNQWYYEIILFKRYKTAETERDLQIKSYTRMETTFVFWSQSPAVPLALCVFSKDTKEQRVFINIRSHFMTS